MALPIVANIIVIAENYNPSIVSKEWLSHKGIFAINVDNFIHTPVFSMVENESFLISVDEQRLQIVIKKSTTDNFIASSQMAIKFVESLPETPYKAVGFNYQYTVSEAQCNLERILSAKPRIIKSVFSSDYQLGTVIVFSFKDFVVTVTVSPPITKEQPYRIAFNFHSDVSNLDDLKHKISGQIDAIKKADAIMQELCQDGK